MGVCTSCMNVAKIEESVFSLMECLLLWICYSNECDQTTNSENYHRTLAVTVTICVCGQAAAAAVQVSNYR